ncbi:hypothetical protein K491DRAFT_693210 [Lophiostoma macrostomum CBS 122681]|uniref:Fungal calcium binding protein domain-containing protein n=1 Tax=Lophiostoma macrostomum CBS 122681 TaxID=1314788 RepID=A0A6A6T6X9_9PLEO|nr:hypothetical protein K491DRAFT_693210 [Lophiostoma macrostomum CBS 122681]
MRSFAIIATLFAAATLAAPTAAVNKRVPLQSVKDAAAANIKQQQEDGCGVLDCVIALAPMSATCAAAAAELELNPIADAACFASILNNLANKPAACGDCSA